MRKRKLLVTLMWVGIIATAMVLSGCATGELCVGMKHFDGAKDERTLTKKNS